MLYVGNMHIARKDKATIMDLKKAPLRLVVYAYFAVNKFGNPSITLC